MVQNDLQKVTAIAKQMVTAFGMSEKVGQISYTPDQGKAVFFWSKYVYVMYA